LEEWFLGIKFCGSCNHNFDVLCKCEKHKCGRCLNRIFEAPICICGWPLVIFDATKKPKLVE
jgi:hypothetical protein